jgi:hypothetical protein
VTTTPSPYRVPRWTKTSRAQLAGVRHPHRGDPADAVLDLDASWRWLRTYYADHIGSPGMTPDARITAEPELEPAWHELRAGLDADAPPKRPSAAQELLRAGIFLRLGPGYNTMQGPVLRALVGLWAARDPALPLAVLREVGPYHVDGLYGGDFGFKLRLVALTPNPHGHRSPVRLDGYHEASLFAAYRAWLMAAPDPAFQAARAAAAPVREALKRGSYDQQRTASFLAYAFARDPAWATADAEELLAGQRASGGSFELVLPALTDPDLALRLAERHGVAIGPHLYARAFDVVESLGGDAAPVLATLLAQGSWRPNQRRPVASALKLAQTAPPRPAASP